MSTENPATELDPLESLPKVDPQVDPDEAFYRKKEDLGTPDLIIYVDDRPPFRVHADIVCAQSVWLKMLYLIKQIFGFRIYLRGKDPDAIYSMLQFMYISEYMFKPTQTFWMSHFEPNPAWKVLMHHVLVYQIGHEYGVKGLKKYARLEFEMEVFDDTTVFAACMEFAPRFMAAVEEIYRYPFAPNDKLRMTAIRCFCSHYRHFVKSTEVLATIPAFKADVEAALTLGGPDTQRFRCPGCAQEVPVIVGRNPLCCYLCDHVWQRRIPVEKTYFRRRPVRNSFLSRRRALYQVQREGA